MARHRLVAEIALRRRRMTPASARSLTSRRTGVDVALMSDGASRHAQSPKARCDIRPRSGCMLLASQAAAHEDAREHFRALRAGSLDRARGRRRPLPTMNRRGRCRTTGRVLVVVPRHIYPQHVEADEPRVSGPSAGSIRPRRHVRLARRDERNASPCSCAGGAGRRDRLALAPGRTGSRRSPGVGDEHECRPSSIPRP
jgi:hypothetical protein